MEPIDIVLHLPWPPTVNNYYAHTRNGVFIKKKGKEFISLVEESAREQSLSKSDPLKDNLCVKVILYPPDKRERDLDNYNKSLLDSLTRAKVWDSDKLIDQLFIFRGREVKKGKAVVMISNGQMIIPVNSEQIIKYL
jgi:crossover junction endodeoxyribonuclease RusA